MPSFLKKTGYKNPQDEFNTIFQTAWNAPGEHQFAWFGKHPEKLRFFNDYMATRRQPALSWLSVYPVLEELGDWEAFDPGRPVYVNVGGGIGHQCKQFRERFPALPGRVVLQDLPHTVAEALPTPGVENIAHNFFEPQPVKGKFSAASLVLTSALPKLMSFRCQVLLHPRRASQSPGP